MDEAAHVPELGEDPAARIVHRRRRRFPAFDLRFGPQARRKGPAKPSRLIPVASVRIRPAAARWA